MYLTRNSGNYGDAEEAEEDETVITINMDALLVLLGLLAVGVGAGAYFLMRKAAKKW